MNARRSSEACRTGSLIRGTRGRRPGSARTTSVTIAPDAGRRRVPEHLDGGPRQIGRVQHAGAHRVVDVVVHVGDDVGDAGNLRLERRRPLQRRDVDRQPVLALGVRRDALTDLIGQVQPCPALLQHLDDAQALGGVREPAGHELVEDALAGVAERRVTEVVGERDGLGQFLVQPQHLGHRAGDLRHLERVRQARPVVIAGRREEDLRLVLQAAGRPWSGRRGRGRAGMPDGSGRQALDVRAPAWRR